MKYCYAHFSRNRPDCKKCRIAKWCKDAREVELLTESMPEYDDTIRSDVEEQLERERAARYAGQIRGERIMYSRNDLLEVIGYMLSLDPIALDLLNEKLADPDISLSEIARRRHTSRQAVQQAMRRKMKSNPELARILNNRENKRRQRKQTTFMEAVCQIRRRMSIKRLNERETGLKYYKTLRCSNRNFDLSKMSMIRGNAFSLKS